MTWINTTALVTDIHKVIIGSVGGHHYVDGVFCPDNLGFSLYTQFIIIYIPCIIEAF